MKGIPLTFRRRIQTGTDAFNNPTHTEVDITVENCLISPIGEPQSAKETQAINQGRDQVRIHLPKSFVGDVSGSEVTWDGKIFSLDSDGVSFMTENTPTAWNKYFRAEFVANYQAAENIQYYPMYWGTSLETNLLPAEIPALQNSAIRSDAAHSFVLNGSGNYIYFAYPESYGMAQVFVNGYWVTDWIIDEVTVDISGTLVPYLVWRSTYKQNGTNIQIELVKSP